MLPSFSKYVLLGSYMLHLLRIKPRRQHATWVRCIAQLNVCVTRVGPLCTLTSAKLADSSLVSWASAREKWARHAAHMLQLRSVNQRLSHLWQL